MDETLMNLPRIEDFCSASQIRNDYLKTDGKPPAASKNTIYHYTSVDVLNEMCKDSGDLLATHFMSLNDSNEFFLGVQLALKELEKCPVLPREIRDVLPDFQKNARKQIVSFLRSESIVPWIVSFSQEPDSLSQWVSYTDRSRGGVAIGFDRNALQLAIKKQDAETGSTNAMLVSALTDCHYTNGNDAEDWLRKKFSSLISKNGNGVSSLREQQKRILAAVFLCATAIKNKSFSSERETRLVLIASHDAARPRYRFVGGKPRIETKLFGPGRELHKAISSVVISPQGNRSRLISAVNILRKQHGLKFPIYVSTSSYNGQ